MMECIIVLPLHLLCLFGTVYLGTLGVDRGSVVSMDHFASFISQTTLSGISGTLEDMKKFYYPEDEYIALKCKPLSSAPASSSYLYLSQTRVEAARSLPVWLEGIRTISSVFLQLDDADNKLLAVQKMKSSNADDGSAAALLKNPGYAANRAETADWAAVANEAFLYGSAPAAVTAESVSAYTRNSDCMTWSVEKQ